MQKLLIATIALVWPSLYLGKDRNGVNCGETSFQTGSEEIQQRANSSTAKQTVQ